LPLRHHTARKDLNMNKCIAVALAAVVSACANAPPADNPSSPNSFRPEAEQQSEARALERAEADCVTQGKHAVAKRVDGDTVYECVAR
jgi:hypothetical protein